MSSYKKLVFWFITILILGGVMFNHFREKSGGMIYLYDSSSQDVYTLNSYDKKSIIASEIVNIKYSDNLKFYIAEDEDNTMYIIYGNGKKKEMAHDVIYDTIKTPDSEKIYFITTNYKLCYKNEVGVEHVVADDVKDYEVLSDKVTVFTDIYDNLFVKKYGDGIYKICSHVSDFKISPHNNLIAYVSYGRLYMTDAERFETEIIAQKNNNGSYEFADNNSIVYFDDYDSSCCSGDIYYKRGRLEKIKAASSCCDFKVCRSIIKNGIYYISSDKTLFYKDLKHNEKSPVKIMDNAEEMIESSNGKEMFVCDDMNNVYKVNRNRFLTSICKNVQEYRPCRNNAAILDNDGNLYFGSSQIARRVKFFDVFKNNIAYVTYDGEICIYRGERFPIKIVDRRCDYKRIVYNNETLFHEGADSEELEGCWRWIDDCTKEAVYYKFDENMNVSISDYNNLEQVCTYSLDNCDYGRNVINIGNMTYDIAVTDEDKITLKDSRGSSIELKKVREDEYDDMKKIVSNIYPAAGELYGSDNFSFECVKNVNGFNYYLYRQKGTDNDDSMRDIYLNEYGQPYVEEDSRMVPKTDKD